MSQHDDSWWELMFKTVENDVKDKEDVLLVVIHWMLIKRGFRCLGLGTERSGTSADVGQETLPSGWNAEEKTTLRYIYKENVYTLHRLKSDDNVIFNLVNVSDLSTSNVTLNINNVKNMKGTLENVLTDYKEVIHKVKSQLIEPVTQRPTKEMEIQTDISRSPDLRGSIDPHPPMNIIPERGIDPLRVDPMEIGRSDLYPFGIGGGGMLFDPFRGGHGSHPPINPGAGAIGGLPRGSIPPGSRFDPIGPILPGPMNPRRPPPDADHLPPPGYDDMFM